MSTTEDLYRAIAIYRSMLLPATIADDPAGGLYDPTHLATATADLLGGDRGDLAELETLYRLLKPFLRAADLNDGEQSGHIRPRLILLQSTDRGCHNCAHAGVDPGDPSVGLAGGYECSLDDGSDGSTLAGGDQCPGWSLAPVCSRHGLAKFPEGDCPECLREIDAAELAALRDLTRCPGAE